MSANHAEYEADAQGLYSTYCPACGRNVRCGPRLKELRRQGYEPEVVGFYRHWLDPDAPKGERDRCVNSHHPVAEAYFEREDGLIITRAEWEASR